MTANSLENKVALITGASRGIGAAIMLELANRGATVIGTATTTKGAANITDNLQANNLHGFGVELNVSDADSVASTLEIISSKYKSPDILVNNAGITSDNLLLRLKEDEWQKVMDINLGGVYRMTKACIRNMLKARFGRIVNISSVVASSGNPGQSNYCAAKAGLLGFTKSIAREFAAKGITANVVAPGFVSTDMTDKLSAEQKQKLQQQIPVNRIGDPADIANAVAFLVSEESGYITGETLHVNGGMFMA